MIDVEVLKDKIKELESKFNQYNAMAQQCLGAIQFASGLINDLNKEEVEEG